MIHKFLALAATVGASLALALPASAATHPHATTACGNRCDDVSGELLGPTFILNASGVGRDTASPFLHRVVNLRLGSNSATNEDWDVDKVGTLTQLCGNPGVNTIDPSSYACLNLSPWAPVFQAELTPNSNPTGFCAGAYAPVEGFKVRLFPCGRQRTFFVEDINGQDPGEGPTGNYIALVYAPDTSASNPLVVGVREFSAHPKFQIVLQREVLTDTDGAVARQLVTQAPLLTGPYA
jgi:hypothetical protein